MRWPPDRLRHWLGNTTFSAARYLRNVVFAVLLVPVLPDIAVDAFGDDEPRWWKPLLRILALSAIVVVLVMFNWFQLWMARRRAVSVVLHRMRAYGVVVLPMSPRRSTFRPATDQTGDPSPPEVIIGQARPTLVVGVATKAVSADQIDSVRAGLHVEGIELEIVRLADPDDAEVTVPEATKVVLDLLQRRNVNPSDVCFDTTGGTVPMSLAMLHAAARYGSDCCYVSSGSRDGVRLPNTQKVSSFDPAALAAGP